MTVTIKMYVNTGFAGVKHEDSFEVDREDWESMSDQEKEKFLDERAVDYLHNSCECGAYVEEV